MVVSQKLEGALIAPLAHENLVGRVLKVADEIGKNSPPKVSPKDIRYIVDSSSMLFFRSRMDS